MKLLSNEKVIDIMSATLNHVDGRLIDHGERVAYLLYKVLKPQARFNDVQLRDICILAMLHDVGAYKTEEIDKMVIFETKDVWEHSVYGSLFLRYFSPLRELSPVILFHHAKCDELGYLQDEDMLVLAQLVSLCDRADVFSVHNGKNDDLLMHINENRNINYRDDIVDMYLAADINIETVFEEMKSDEDFNNIFHKTPLSEEEAIEYINMIVYTIDFRSSQTVIHTLSTVCVAEALARILGLNENEINIIKTGAVLHDIGKVGIPIHILESSERLNDEDMSIMKNHVRYTEEIINGNVDEVIKRIAVNHHEKLNGEGYPNSLDGQAITMYDRIVAIADIFTALNGARSYKDGFSKEKVVKILNEMAEQQLLDQKIVETAINHYDDIVEQIKKESEPIIKAYEEMHSEYHLIREELHEKFTQPAMAV
ncbi:MAG: HD domain-containing protein [Oscillospiraceae bacterium]|nr:HD domain-containing protein [Oscillospiraceae bacterium]